MWSSKDGVEIDPEKIKAFVEWPHQKILNRCKAS